MSGPITERLLPPKEARRCLCGEPNTTGLCAYPVGKCPRESKPESGTQSEQAALGGTPALWRCETCRMPQHLSDHGPNTMCPYGLVEAIRAGWITDEEASRRLTAHV